jgi:hypothetical protein
VAVTVALLLVPILVCLAFVADAGLLYWEKAELQNGADAAAIAVASECAVDGPSCVSGAQGVASGIASDNANDDQANASLPPAEFIVNASSGTVRVIASTLNSEGTAIRHPFASLLGLTESTITATASAKWGVPIAGRSFPLAIAECEFSDMPTQPADVTNPTVTELLINNGNTSEPCSNGYPGGFGWLDATSCEAVVAADGTVQGTPGIQPNQNSTGCTSADFDALLCETKLIPLYSATTANGSNGIYTISRFAAFTITAVKTGGAQSARYCTEYPNLPAFTGGGNAKGIQGFFVEYVDLGDDFELGELPGTGLIIVQLTD